MFSFRELTVGVSVALMIALFFVAWNMPEDPAKDCSPALEHNKENY